ncbi:hypothetical protein LPJ53_002374 [Coemansia erecta]|uniref:Exonuclease domain-containing protein n=1 Tax=Coemansia erecta TaxID=147472 RepID=A0A9W7Y1I1_9FUNG|nr:hypothetical protein LPJ53_002374 [Coemansia erecta]
MPLKSLSSAPLVWIDVETTGLVPEKDVMLEIAMVITDGNLDQLGQPQSLVISQPPEQLRKLNAWSKNCHTKSGLLDDVAKSSLTLQQAESVLMEQVTKYCKRPNKAVLAGNNVGFDRAFISRYMPVLSGYLHFRNIDVSSVNELAKRWRPDVVSQYKKTYSHRAMDDINESIRELKHYQDTIFRR